MLCPRRHVKSLQRCMLSSCGAVAAVFDMGRQQQQFRPTQADRPVMPTPGHPSPSLHVTVAAAQQCLQLMVFESIRIAAWQLLCPAIYALLCCFFASSKEQGVHQLPCEGVEWGVLDLACIMPCNGYIASTRRPHPAVSPLALSPEADCLKLQTPSAHPPQPH